MYCQQMTLQHRISEVLKQNGWDDLRLVDYDAIWRKSGHEFEGSTGVAVIRPTHGSDFVVVQPWRHPGEICVGLQQQTKTPMWTKGSPDDIVPIRF